MEFSRIVWGTCSWGRKLLSGSKNSVHVTVENTRSKMVHKVS